MLRKKEARKQRIDAQQTLARQAHEIRVSLGEVALLLQRGELFSELPDDIDAVLVGEVRRTDPSELQLEDQLAPHALLGRRTIRACERQIAAIDRLAVSLPRVVVLHVHAVHMAERRNAKRRHVRTLPQAIAVDEARSRRIL